MAGHEAVGVVSSSLDPPIQKIFEIYTRLEADEARQSGEIEACCRIAPNALQTRQPSEALPALPNYLDSSHWTSGKAL